MKPQQMITLLIADNFRDSDLAAECRAFLDQTDGDLSTSMLADAMLSQIDAERFQGGELARKVLYRSLQRLGRHPGMMPGYVHRGPPKVNRYHHTAHPFLWHAFDPAHAGPPEPLPAIKQPSLSDRVATLEDRVATLETQLGVPRS